MTAVTVMILKIVEMNTDCEANSASLSNSTASSTLLREVGTAEDTMSAAAVNLSSPISHTISHASKGPATSLNIPDKLTSTRSDRFIFHSILLS